MPSYPPEWTRHADRSAFRHATRDTGSASLFWAVVFTLTCSALILYMLMQLMPSFAHMR
jgi:hypothetical protein